jgi:tetratricopeptide (TPR) repeat protein
MGVVILGSLFLVVGCQQPELTSAKLYLSQSNWDKTIEQAQLAIKANPQNAESYFVLGQAYGNKQMYREMNDAFTNSLKYSTKFASEIDKHRNNYWVNIFNNGVSYIKQDKLNEAVDEFKLSIEILPEKINSYKNLAFVYTQLDNDDAAIETYKTAIEVAPTDTEVKNFLGILYYQTKQYENAIAILGEVINKSDPSTKVYIEALQHIAFCYDLLGQSEKAIEAYNNAIENAPDNMDLIFNLGRLFFIKEDYEQAITHFKKLLENNPDDFDANLNTANAYLSMEKFDESIPYYQKAVEIKPDNVNAWNNLGVAYVRAGQQEKGEAAFKKADELKATQ